MAEGGYSPEEASEDAELQELRDQLDSEPLLKDEYPLSALADRLYLSGGISKPQLKPLVDSSIRHKAAEYGVKSGDVSKITLAAYLDSEIKKAEKGIFSSSESLKVQAQDRLRNLQGVKNAWGAGQADVVKLFLKEKQDEALAETRRAIHAKENPTSIIGQQVRAHGGTTETAIKNVINRGVDYMTVGKLLDKVQSSTTTPVAGQPTS